MENQGLPRTLVMGIAGLIFIVLFGSSMFVTIEPGEKGVLFKKFGGGLDKETVFQNLYLSSSWEKCNFLRITNCNLINSSNNKIFSLDI